MKSNDKSFLYGSHLPILTAIFDILSPKEVVEFGAGLHSTEFFLKNSDDVISIETEIEWYNKMKGLKDTYDNLTVVYHDVGGGVGRKTKDISKTIKNNVFKFYQEILGDSNRCMMFVDHVSGLRAFTIAKLYSKYDIIIYHDAQSKGYRYDSLKRLDLSDYIHLIHKSFSVHTGVLIKKDRISNVSTLIDRIKVLEKEYCDKFNVTIKKSIIDKV